MTPLRSSIVRSCLAIVLTTFAVLPAHADFAPQWSDAELTRFADAILTGRVSDVATGWDGDTIYTYVTLDVGTVLKGWVPERQIILKQLGGRVNDVALVISGQATFSRGEDVLVFLEARPRDGTLSTTALWQGKWTIRADPATGERVAARPIRGAGDRRSFAPADAETRPLAAFASAIRGAVGPAAQSIRDGINVHPRDADSATPVKDVDATRVFWPREARDMRIGAGDCFTRFATDGAVSITRGDPCGEMSRSGGTLAISGAWVNAASDSRSDDAFMQIVHAGVITNVSGASEYLTKPACLSAIDAHELDHALGRRADDGSQAFLDRGCAASASTSLVISSLSGRLSVDAGARASAQASAAISVVTTRASVASDGSQATGPSSLPSVSADGRYVAFLSRAPNLTGQPSSTLGLVVHDNQSGATTYIGTNANAVTSPRITSDGRYILFAQFAAPDGSITAWDQTLGAVTLLSAPARISSVSDDIRYVAYVDGVADLYVVDRQMLTSTRVAQAASNAVLSPDGRFVAYSGLFTGTAAVFDQLTSLTIQVTGARPVAFSVDNRYLLLSESVVDLVAGVTTSSLPVCPGLSLGLPSISPSGRYVAYRSPGSCSRPSTPTDVYLYDRQTTQTVRVSVASDGASANGTSTAFAVDNNGRVAYQSAATNLVAGDTNNADDVFLTSGGVDAGLGGQPTGLAATVTRANTGFAITLTWNAPIAGGVPANYLITAGSAPGRSDLASFLTGSTATSFSTTVPGTGVFYARVAAVTAAGTGIDSSEIVVSVGGVAPPGPPRNLAFSISGSVITLTWNAPATGDPPVTYVIEASTTPGGVANLANFSTGNAATTFTATGVGAGTYFVRVLAASSAGVGPPSNEVTLLVLGPALPCTGPPAPPNGLASAVSGSTVTLQWNASVGPTTSYMVEAGSSSGLTDLANFDTGGTATTLTVTGVGAGTYFVRVRGKNACGATAPSNETVFVVR